MTYQLPLVLVGSASPNEGSLQLEDGDTVEVGTPRWFKWLEGHNSFRFESGFAGENSFTARKHERESGAFWYAYRKLGKRLGNAYLGKSERLSVGRMLEVAAKLSQPPKTESQGLGNGYAETGYAKQCITTPQHVGDDDPDDDSDPDIDDPSEPTDEQTIIAQANKIQGYIAEVRLQEREIQALKDERDQLRHQLDDMTAKAGEWYDKAKECEEQRLQSEPTFPDLEAVRDRILQGLKLGRQAPEYRRTKTALDKLIAELRSLGS